MEMPVVLGWAAWEVRNCSVRTGPAGPRENSLRTSPFGFGSGSCGPQMHSLEGSAGDTMLRDMGPGGGGAVCRIPSTPLGFLRQAIYKLKKACRVEVEADQQGQLLTPEEVVDRIFLLVDENGDGNRG